MEFLWDFLSRPFALTTFDSIPMWGAILLVVILIYGLFKKKQPERA